MAPESEVFRLWEASVLQCECLGKIKMYVAAPVYCSMGELELDAKVLSRSKVTLHVILLCFLSCL